MPQHLSLFHQLRVEYPFFEYQSYRFWEDELHYHLQFNFNLANKYLFQPETVIPKKSFITLPENKASLDWLVFHIGMVELISYWKLACPPLVIIKPFSLDEQQISWWKKLYFNGLGEFFYINNIQIRSEEFMEIRVDTQRQGKAIRATTQPITLVPVGGGKDSVVTLELLSAAGEKLIPFIVNPRQATTETARIAGYGPDETFVVHRKLDPLILQLNQQGFLNGHTPFSALLAFNTALAALLTGAQNIALSNESSASESTVHGQNINHQYSKSLEFEDDFIWYMRNYLLSPHNYFSFLRPFSEMQIAAIFARLEKYHATFKSCNAGSKTDSWCNNCSKCLFTYIMLAAFMPPHKVEAVFGENLLSKASLKPIMLELRGKTAAKPFECVGTVEEVDLACRVIQSEMKTKNPVLLDDLGMVDVRDTKHQLKAALQHFDTHRIPEARFINILRDAIRG